MSKLPNETISNNKLIIGNHISGGSSASVLFIDGYSNLEQDNTYFAWDNYSHRLGIGINAPSYTLHIVGDGYLTSRMLINASSASVSSSGTGAFRFNGSTNHLELSENGGAWTQLGSIAGNATSAQVSFGSSNNAISSSNTFKWDNTKKTILLGDGLNNNLSISGNSTSLFAAGIPYIAGGTSGNGHLLVRGAASFSDTGDSLNIGNDSGGRSAGNIINFTDGGLSLGQMTWGGNWGFSADWSGVFQPGLPSTETPTFKTSSSNIKFTKSFTTQRFNLFTTPSFAGNTITNAATVAIAGAPIAIDGAILTNAYSLWIQGGNTRLDGGLILDGYDFDLSGGAAKNQVLTYDGNRFIAADLLNGGGVAGLTPNHIPVANSSTSIIDTPLTYNGTTFSFNIASGGNNLQLTDGTRTASYLLDDTGVHFGSTTNHSLLVFTNNSPAQAQFYTNGHISIATAGNTVDRGYHLSVEGAIYADSLFRANQTFADPTNATRSIGTKFLAYDQLSPTQLDWAMGVNANSLWFSIDRARSGRSFQWWGNDTGTGSTATDTPTTIMELYGDGALRLRPNPSTAAQPGAIRFDGSNVQLCNDGVNWASISTSNKVGALGEHMVSIIPAGTNQSNKTSTPLIVSVFSLDPTYYSLTSTTQSIAFRAIVANSSNTAYVKLRNLTDNSDVATLDFSTTTITMQEILITDLIPLSAKLYEVSIYTDSSTEGFLQLYSAELRVVNTIN